MCMFINIHIKKIHEGHYVIFIKKKNQNDPLFGIAL